MVDRVAPFDELVLITGETGTGKELIARRLHTMSPRRDNPFVVLNAATLDAAMAGSALFGHCKGAFTGAENMRLGAFRSAQGGTFFLDEIGELTLEMQARILRAIELREITPVGEDRSVQVDVRVVVATNRDLSEMVRAGTFRLDLYQRLCQFPLLVSPLRERAGDIQLLTEAFVEQWNRRYDGNRTLPADAVSLLERYGWPGNVRQLRHIVSRLCLMADESGEITLDSVRIALEREEQQHGKTAGTIPAPGTADAHPAQRLGAGPVDLRVILEETERSWYDAALTISGGNQAEAARLLGVKPPAFRKAMRERLGGSR